LEAFVLGLSRGLAAIDETARPLLRKNGLLTRDQRVRERRKVGMGGKARRKRQSPKR
jgi:small subunit ribosomal protein S9